MQNSYYLGVDVSKGYSDFVILDAKKKPVVENFQLDDTFEGHCFLHKHLCKFLDSHPESTIFAAVESTGGYENNWFQSLVSFQNTLNLKAARLNPLGVNANSKASMNRNTTDKISAQNVAEYLISHSEKVSYNNEDQLASLRKQWTFVKMLTKQNTQLLNQLESLLYSSNPEILIYCKNGLPQWVLKLLLRYPTAACLSKARASSVARIPYISATHTQTLIANAKKSVASAVDNITKNLIITTVKQILHLKKTITDQTKKMTAQCSMPEIDILKSFPGINDYSAIGLMMEIQTVKRFLNPKKLASFFGLHPVFKISGDGKSGIHMSKKGRREPRRILFMVALCGIRSNPLIRDIYQKHVQKGMPKMAAIGLCMHKTLRIIYGMLKNNKPFDPEIDRKNREKSNQIKKKIKPNKNRRYQKFDSMAPVSRRQNLSRKEQEQSQSDNIAENGIIAPAPVSV